MTATVSHLYPERKPAPGKVALSPGAEHDLDQAELFLLSLEGETADLSMPRAAYLLGVAEGHVANLIEAIRSVTR